MCAGAVVLQYRATGTFLTLAETNSIYAKPMERFNNPTCAQPWPIAYHLSESRFEICLVDIRPAHDHVLPVRTRVEEEHAWLLLHATNGRMCCRCLADISGPQGEPVFPLSFHIGRIERWVHSSKGQLQLGSTQQDVVSVERDDGESRSRCVDACLVEQSLGLRVGPIDRKCRNLLVAHHGLDHETIRLNENVLKQIIGVLRD